MESEYTEDSFWNKITKHALSAGEELIRAALNLYFAAQSDNTPGWAKAVIYGALGYFILPVDAIPDLLPGVGYADDIGAITAATATIAVHIDEDVKKKAESKLKDWFG